MVANRIARYLPSQPTSDAPVYLDDDRERMPVLLAFVLGCACGAAATLTAEWIGLVAGGLMLGLPWRPFYHRREKAAPAA